jgi:hypothetical protein
MSIHEEIRDFYKENPETSKTKAAKKFGVSRKTIWRALTYNGKKESPYTNSRLHMFKSSNEVHVDLGNKSGKVTTEGSKIKTIDDALKYADINMEEWEVDRCVSNHWDTTMKTDDGTKTVTNYQIKIFLKKKTVNHVKEALNNIKEIKSINVKKPKKVNSGNQAFIGLYDTHFGKLGYEAQTGEGCNIEKTKNFYINAIVDTLERLKAFDVSKIIYPIGQDFLHINNSKNTTANDTPQDVDGILTQVYSTAFEASIIGIEECLKVCPVEVVYVSGNHDRDTSWFLTHAISQRFGKTKHLSVDLDIIGRKYRSFGKCIIGLSHADNKRQRAKLHNLMAVEQREKWSVANCCEWLTGHYHKRGEEKVATVDTDLMQTVRTLPSLSGRDRWHFDNAFISPRACETYIYSPNDGYLGHISTNPR